MDFTSADVQATFDRIFSPPEGVITGQMTDLFEPIESVETTGSHEVRITLKRITPWFLELMAADPLFGPAVIYPKQCHRSRERGPAPRVVGRHGAVHGQGQAAGRDMGIGSEPELLGPGTALC